MILVSLQPIRHWIDSTWKRECISRPNQQATSDTTTQPWIAAYLSNSVCQDSSRPSHNHSSSQANKARTQHCGSIDDSLFRPIHWREAMIGGEAHPRQKDGSFPKEGGKARGKVHVNND